MTIGTRGMYEAKLAGVSTVDRETASRVCPFSDLARDEDELADALYPNLPRDPRTGAYQQVLAGRLTSDVELPHSSSGGLTSVVLVGLLERGLVDGVIHVGRGDRSLFEHKKSYSVEELLESRKSMYFSTTLSEVIGSVKGDGKAYAVVGVPCFIKAMRSLIAEMPELEGQFPYMVGLVCGHMKSQFFAQSLAWQVGIEPSELEALDFRVKNPSRQSSSYDYQAKRFGEDQARLRRVATTIDGSWGYGAFQPEACNFCDDIFAETADVALGDAWLPQYKADWRGTNVAIVRDPTISAILDDAKNAGQIQTERITLEEAAASQSGNFRHRRTGLRVRLADDVKAGLSVPKKRVAPGYDGVTRARISLIRTRRALSRLSLNAFAEALASGDYSRYAVPMGRLIFKYRAIDAYGHGPIAFAKFIAKTVLKRD